MSKKNYSLEELTNQVNEFIEEREWAAFHDSKDLALSLVVEAVELMELTQWHKGVELESHLKRNRDRLSEELSDVLYWTLLIAHTHDINLSDAFERKMALNRRKYPVALARGTSAKYTELAKLQRKSRPSGVVPQPHLDLG